MITRSISLVPSYIVVILTSRASRSKGYSKINNFIPRLTAQE